MSIDTTGEADKKGKPDGRLHLKDLGSGKGRTRIARPNAPSAVPLEDIKAAVRSIAPTAAKLSPLEYMESARGLYREIVSSCGSLALTTVNFVLLEAFRLRNDKKKQGEKVEAMLADFSPDTFAAIPSSFLSLLYSEDQSEAVISEIISKAAAFLAGLIEEPQWEKIPQGRIINDIERPNEYLPLIEPDDMLKGTVKIHHNNLILKAASAGILSSLNASTFQFLDFLLLKAHKLGNFSGFSVSVSEYMRARGLKDRKGAKAQIKKACSDLYEVSIRYNAESLSKAERRKLPKGFPLNVDFRILDAKAEINKRGDIAVSFGKAFAPYLAAVPPMEYHKSLLRINTHTYPYAHALGRKLLEVFNMNIERNRAEIEAGRYEVRLAVETLLSVTGLPSEEKVMSLDRNLLARIIRPFEKDLSGLAEMGSWEYCRTKGEPLKPEDDPKDFASFKGLYIRFSFKDYPLQARRFERQEEKLAACQRRKEKAAAKKKEAPKA